MTMSDLLWLWLFCYTALVCGRGLWRAVRGEQP